MTQILGLWITCGVKMMWLCHVWGWQPPQTASHIHIGHIKSDWAHWYAIHEQKYHPYTDIPTLLGSDFGALGCLWSQNDVIMLWLRLTATSNCFPHPYWTYTKWFSTLICYPWANSITLTQLYPPSLVQILGLWVACGVKMMWRGWQPPQTASHIHIRHMQSGRAHLYAIHGHTVSPLHSYTHPTWLRFWDSGSLVESKW